MITPPQQKKKSKLSIFAAIFFIASMSFLIIVIIMPGDEETRKSNITREQLDSLYGVEKRTDAYVMSQQFLKKRLKSPSSADFPFDYDGLFTKYIGDSTFVIAAYVDSQNSFGAMLRTNYNATVKNTDGDNWKLIELKLEE